jgi:hypothetical protein
MLALDKPLLLEFRLDVIGPPQFVARCPECGRLCRWRFRSHRWRAELLPGSSGV